MVAEEARSAHSSDCSPTRFSASPRATITLPRAQCGHSSKRAGVVGGGAQRGDDKAGVGALRRMRGVCANAALATPAIERAVGKSPPWGQALTKLCLNAPRPNRVEFLNVIFNSAASTIRRARRAFPTKAAPRTEDVCRRRYHVSGRRAVGVGRNWGEMAGANVKPESYAASAARSRARRTARAQ
jgi:hypothetical protein